MIFSAVIAVGLAVTHQPPHRSRRAVFPHRALQYYSLPQSAFRQRNFLSGSLVLRDLWSWYLEVFQHLFEAFPIKAFLLASPIQPLPQDPHRLLVKFVQSGACSHHGGVAQWLSR
jgi:hypothetical protein